eukprot:90399-Chlamydomonas_euryale.AAC.2
MSSSLAVSLRLISSNSSRIVRTFGSSRPISPVTWAGRVTCNAADEKVGAGGTEDSGHFEAGQHEKWQRAWVTSGTTYMHMQFKLFIVGMGIACSCVHGHAHKCMCLRGPVNCCPPPPRPRAALGRAITCAVHRSLLHQPSLTSMPFDSVTALGKEATMIPWLLAPLAGTIAMAWVSSSQRDLRFRLRSALAASSGLSSGAFGGSSLGRFIGGPHRCFRAGGGGSGRSSAPSALAPSAPAAPALRSSSVRPPAPSAPMPGPEPAPPSPFAAPSSPISGTADGHGIPDVSAGALWYSGAAG